MKRGETHDPGDDLPASPVMLDGYLRLAAAVLVHALAELRDPDPVEALDAFTWLCSDGLLWLRAIGLDVTMDDLFGAILEGSVYGAKHVGRPIAAGVGAAPHHSRTETIPEIALGQVA